MIELSCKCLKSILSTESGAEAYEYLDNEAKNYLNPYKPSKSGSKNNSVSFETLHGNINIYLCIAAGKSRSGYSFGINFERGISLENA